MKILLVADLHYTLRQWDWVMTTGDRFDLVVVAGDLLDIASIVPLEAQIVVVRKYLGRIAGKAPLLVSSGNHDIIETPGADERTAEWLHEEFPVGAFTDGDQTERGGVHFSILPWWEGPETRARIDEQLAAQAEEAKGKPWVWIYHPPPEGSSVAWDGRADHGDDRLIEWIDRHHPWMILGGHIHNAPFVKNGSWIDELHGTLLINGGRQIGSVPTFTVIDTGERNAKWISMEDAEQADLVLPLQRRPLES